MMATAAPAGLTISAAGSPAAAGSGSGAGSAAPSTPHSKRKRAEPTDDDSKTASVWQPYCMIEDAFMWVVQDLATLEALKRTEEQLDRTIESRLAHMKEALYNAQTSPGVVTVVLTSELSVAAGFSPDERIDWTLTLSADALNAFRCIEFVCDLETYPYPPSCEWYLYSARGRHAVTGGVRVVDERTLSLSRSGPPTTVKVLLHPNVRHQRYQVPPDLAALIGSQVATKPQIINGIYAYAKSENLLQFRRQVIVRLDQRLQTALGAQSESVLLTSLEELLKPIVTAAQPLECRFTVGFAEHGGQASAQFQVEVDLMDPRLASWEALLLAVSRDWEPMYREVEVLDEQAKHIIAEIEKRTRSRDFFRAFATDPVTFFHQLVDSQAHDLAVLSSVGASAGDSSTPPLSSALFRHPWVFDAAAGLLTAKDRAAAAPAAAATPSTGPVASAAMPVISGVSRGFVTR